jgi:hypothetical protein|tara:strand:+ start:31 stop:204 length:174 start_codon:yes stop_codon:yes gene_type:complete
MGNCILCEDKDMKDDVYEPIIAQLYHSPDNSFITSVSYIETMPIQNNVPPTPFVSAR